MIGPSTGAATAMIGPSTGAATAMIGICLSLCTLYGRIGVPNDKLTPILPAPRRTSCGYGEGVACTLVAVGTLVVACTLVAVGPPIKVGTGGLRIGGPPSGFTARGLASNGTTGGGPTGRTSGRRGRDVGCEPATASLPPPPGRPPATARRSAAVVVPGVGEPVPPSDDGATDGPLGVALGASPARSTATSAPLGEAGAVDSTVLGSLTGLESGEQPTRRTSALAAASPTPTPVPGAGSRLRLTKSPQIITITIRIAAATHLTDGHRPNHQSGCQIVIDRIPSSSPTITAVTV